jgi:serine/threonine protein kinase
VTLAAGFRLGSYEIVAPLGAGGMGEVYRARDSQLEREVAIKVLSDALARDPEHLARFAREARSLAAVNHPNIAAIHGLDEKDGMRFLVLELVEGESLDLRLRAAPLPVSEALDLAGQIASALGAAHEKGIVHRDLKPSNVRRDAGGPGQGVGLRPGQERRGSRTRRLPSRRRPPPRKRPPARFWARPAT